MKLKCSLLLILVSFLVEGGIAFSTGSRQQEAKKESTMKDAAPTPQPSPRSYSKDLKELRARFNRDKGTVRLVTLLSPT